MVSRKPLNDNTYASVKRNMGVMVVFRLSDLKRTRAGLFVSNGWQEGESFLETSKEVEDSLPLCVAP